MLFSMFILMICSIIIGYIFYDAFIGIGSTFLINSIFINISNYSILDAEFSLFFIKYLALIFTLLGIFSFFIINKFFFNFYIIKNRFFYNFYYFFNKALYFDYIFNNLILTYILNFSYYIIYKYIEKGIFELYGPIYIYYFINRLYYLLKYFNKGLIYDYIFIIL